MMNEHEEWMLNTLRQATVLLLIFSVVTGMAYPALVTGVAQLLFPKRANGSLLVIDGRITGSELIGQHFSDPGYFWGRLSATTPIPYNAAASSGSNYGPMSDALRAAASERIRSLRAADSTNVRLVPVDLATASGSGLDPHISLAAAEYQIPRVARARALSETALRALVERHIEQRGLGFLGEKRVNVLLLNVALDSVTRTGGR